MKMLMRRFGNPGQDAAVTGFDAKGPLAEGIGFNREIKLEDYSAFAANAQELRAMGKASAIADRFLDVKALDSKDFRTEDLRSLYEYLFPNEDEREDFSVISARISDMARLERGDRAMMEKYGKTKYHAIAALKEGRVIGFAFFTTMPLDSGKVLVYSQYAGIADRDFMLSQYGVDENFRSRGLLSTACPMMMGIASEDGRRFGSGTVFGMINESEMIGQGTDPVSIAFTKYRLETFNRNGSKIMMLKMPDGSLVTPHIQPGLDETSNTVLMHVLVRPSRFDPAERRLPETIGKREAAEILGAFIDNFSIEGFERSRVAEAKIAMMGRVMHAESVFLLPPSMVPDIIALARMDSDLACQVIRDYGSIEAHEELLLRSLRGKPVRTLGE